MCFISAVRLKEQTPVIHTMLEDKTIQFISWEMKSIVMQKYFIVLFSNMAYVTGVYSLPLESFNILEFFTTILKLSHPFTKKKPLKKMNSLQQQQKCYHQNVLINSFHLNGHSFRYTDKTVLVLVKRFNPHVFKLLTLVNFFSFFLLLLRLRPAQVLSDLN